MVENLDKISSLFAIEKSDLHSLYLYGYQDGIKNLVKSLFTLDNITIDKIAEITKLSTKEIEQLTNKK